MKKNVWKLNGMLAGIVLLCGCASEKIAEGLTTKNTSGNGTVIESHIGINTDTKIPELKTLFISGDIATVKAGTNAVSYREESSASVWNASSVTKKRFLAITLTDKGDVPNAIRAVAEVFKTAEGAAAEKPAEVKADGVTEREPSVKTETRTANGVEQPKLATETKTAEAATAETAGGK